MGAKSAFTTGNHHCKPRMIDVIVIHSVKKKMALQPRSMTHQAYAQFLGHPVSTSKEIHLMLINIHANHKKGEKPVGVNSAFTVGNYHCKPLMTDVIVIHRVKKKHYTSAKVYDPPSLCPILGTSCVHKQRGPLDAYKYSYKS